ncbi:MAG: DUF3343 domain-containing protein [Gemmatimonadetes bacterium]|nr:DUF3343 domain-containing protein [Gemmatimonadota bacterium]
MGAVHEAGLLRRGRGGERRCGGRARPARSSGLGHANRVEDGPGGQEDREAGVPLVRDGGPVPRVLRPRLRAHRILRRFGGASAGDPAPESVTESGHEIFLFDTTNAALWAEEVAREARVPAEVVPAPRGSGARCDLALATRSAESRRLERALAAAGVPFRLWSVGGCHQAQ